MKITGTDSSVKPTVELVRPEFKKPVDNPAQKAPAGSSPIKAKPQETSRVRIDVPPKVPVQENPEKKITVKSPLSEKYYDYTVDSEHELIIKVKDSHTKREIRQIPNEKEIAAKRALKRSVEKLFDKKV